MTAPAAPRVHVCTVCLHEGPWSGTWAAWPPEPGKPGRKACSPECARFLGSVGAVDLTGGSWR